MLDFKPKFHRQITIASKDRWVQSTQIIGTSNGGFSLGDPKAVAEEAARIIAAGEMIVYLDPKGDRASDAQRQRLLDLARDMGRRDGVIRVNVK